jgi:uncharacterized membrane protein
MLNHQMTNPLIRVPVPAPKRFDGWAIGLLCVALFFSVTSMAFPSVWGGWSDALLAVSVTLWLLTSLARDLPLQNVILAAMIIGFIGSMANAVGTVAHLPFGPLRYELGAGPRFSSVLPWFAPLIWISVILTGRGVARLILRSQRGKFLYGFWLIALAAVLALIVDFGVETWATQVKHYWSWRSTAAIPQRGSVPSSLHFTAWFATATAILVMIAPWLIRKQPGERPPDYQPLIVWVLLHGWFAAAAFGRGLAIFAGLSALAATVIPWVAVRQVKISAAFENSTSDISQPTAHSPR